MVKLEQISESVWDYYYKELEGHISIVKLTECLVFIDSGHYPQMAKEVREKAEECLGLPTKYLILTHHHDDHIWGNQEFEDCEIIASKAVLDLLKIRLADEKFLKIIENMKNENPERYGDLRIILPTKTFINEYQIEDDNIRIQIYQTDGHSEGSSFVLIPEERVLIAGDLLFSQMFPYFGDPTADVYKWIDCYNKMLELSPKIVIPGHGDIVDKKEIISQKKYLQSCINWMIEFIKKGHKKEELEDNKDFPVHPGEIPVENFEEFLNDSKLRTYDVIRREMG